MKVSVSGFILASQEAWQQEPEFIFREYDASKYGSQDKVLVKEHTIEFDVPDNFDMRPGLVANLEAKKKALQAEFTARINEITRQINEIIEMPRRESAGIVSSQVHQFSAVEIRQRVNLVQEVMRSIMKSDTHYGVIPGTKKPSLYKPGAEVLCVTFRIGDKYEVEDLTVDGMARYRVRCIGIHQVTGIVLGEGLGECSSHEEKYKWRRAICAEEFEVTPENLRRLKFSKYQGKVEKQQQIRTESADQANTILKMACKRAKIAMTLNATAASDIFTQDIEDLPEEYRHDDEPGEPILSALGAKLVAEANAVTTREQFDALWKRGVKEINAAKDGGASDAFKAAMEAKSKTLPAKVAEPPPREPGQDDAELEADFQQQIAREQGGAQ
jgi:hypothetical protein